MNASPELLPPFDEFDPDELLEHYRGQSLPGRAPRGPRLFSVADADAVSPAAIDGVVAGRFSFNCETHDLPDPVPWLENPSRDLEWHILLHKFYYATGLAMAYERSREPRYLQRWVDLTSGWIDTVPPGFIATDVTGRRVQNWIYAHFHFVRRLPSAPVPPQFHLRLLASIEEQVDYLVANLTPKRNHRTLELYAVFLAGVAFPEFRRAAGWRDHALGQLVDNIQADLLADGVHCELSTDYHHLVLRNYLCARRLAALNDIAVPAVMDSRLQSALEFAMHVHKPDGIVPALSDGDARGFPELLQQGASLYGREDLRYVATRGAAGRAPDRTAALFADSGYCIIRSGWGEGRRRFEDEHYLILDCGPLGEGNHGHFDCLSFELAAGGRSLIVDPGRYTYSEAGDVNWRVRFRGTASHNTVTVDQRNQTRYLPRAVAAGGRHAPGSTRHKIAGPGPEATVEAFDAGSRLAWVRGSARSAEYDAVHTRSILFAFDEYWLVLDQLVAPGRHRYDLRLQLSEAAGSRVELRTTGGTTTVVSPDLLVGITGADPGQCGIDDGWVSYRYGTRLPAPVIRATRHAGRATFCTVLVPCPDAARRSTRLQVRAHAVVPGAGSRGADEAGGVVLEVAGASGLPGATDLFLVGPGRRQSWSWSGGRFGGGCVALRRTRDGGPIESRHTDGAWCDPCGQAPAVELAS